MAVGRKIKKGLDYFQIDTRFFSDIKIRKTIKYAGPDAVLIYVCLLVIIYRDGYYIHWDEDMPFIVSEETGINEEEINQALVILLKVGLFSVVMFDTHQILTSKGIQERYQRINILSKRKSNVTEFSLIDSQEIEDDSEGIEDDSEGTGNTSNLTTQKKRKNKIKEEKEDNNASDTFPIKPDSWGNYKSLDDIKTVLLESKTWHASYAKSAGITNPSHIPLWIEKFFDHAAASGKDHKTLTDAKSHCLNWTRKQIEAGVSLEGNSNKPKKLSAIQERSLKIIKQQELNHG